MADVEPVTAVEPPPAEEAPPPAVEPSPIEESGPAPTETPSPQKGANPATRKSRGTLSPEKSRNPYIQGAVSPKKSPTGGTGKSSHISTIKSLGLLHELQVRTEGLREGRRKGAW